MVPVLEFAPGAEENIVGRLRTSRPFFAVTRPEAPQRLRATAVEVYPVKRVWSS